MRNDRWSREQLKLAFHLYCQLPFGKLHSRNAEIVELAQLIGRTPSAVAMKLVNFASLDPAITSTGRAGLGNAGSLDREIWEEFQANWEGLAVECNRLRTALVESQGQVPTTALDADEATGLEDFTGETRRVVTEQRIKQHFVRRAVLSSYRGRCCMSGLSEPRLLIASHIVPWSKDATLIRRKIEAELRALPAGQHHDLDQRFAAFRRVAISIPPRHQSERNRLKYALHYLADTVWPPLRILRVIRAWRDAPASAAAATQRHRPAARFVISGHTHRPGIWRMPGGITVVNTGSYCPPLGGCVADVTTDRLIVRRVEARAGEFHPGGVVAAFPLAAR